MERCLMNEDAQWIIMMGFLVSFSFFFLAMVINQSTVVGQTTAESVSEFPKNDIRDTRNAILWSVNNGTDIDWVQRDMSAISLSRRDAVVGFSTFTSIDHEFVYIHFNNGVTAYNENWTIL
jgi:hypothetical protein